MYTFIFIILVYVTSVAWPAWAQGPRLANRFGLGEAYLNPEAASEAGAGYSRIFFHWDQIQPKSRDDWQSDQLPDQFLQAEINAGREVVAVVLGTPAWAGLEDDLPQAVPDLEAWGSFVRQMAEAYQGRIKYWVIWHEPELGADHPKFSWAGTPEDYVALLKTAYFSIKEVDPAMEVHLAGLTYHWDKQRGQEPYLARLLTAINADPEASRHNFYFDAVVYHLYTTPRYMLNILNESRGLLDQYRLTDKPIWVNEFNLPPDYQALSDDEQAAYVMQAFTLLAAGGARRFQYYRLDDGPSLHGLLSPDNHPTQAYTAYQTMARHLTRYTRYTWVQENGIYVITLDQRRQTTTIIWNTASFEQVYRLNAIAPKGSLIRAGGQTMEITAEEGQYQLTLPPAACEQSWCPIGSTPLILVEAGSLDQRSASLPLVTPTATASPEPTATAASAQIVRIGAPISGTQTPFAPPAQAIAQANQISRPPDNLNSGNRAARGAQSQSVAQTLMPESGPQPSASLLEAQAPALADAVANTTVRQWLQLIDTGRIVSLVVLGALLFTFFYFVQFRLWNSFKNR